jgi:hypothetical protein
VGVKAAARTCGPEGEHNTRGVATRDRGVGPAKAVFLSVWLERGGEISGGGKAR